MARKNIEENHQPFLTAIGEKIKEYRIEKKYTMDKMARKVGMSRNGYSMMEKGQIYFNLSSLLDILDKLNLDHKDFFRDL